MLPALPGDGFTEHGPSVLAVGGRVRRVTTKPDAPDTLPGSDPASFIHSELKAKRAHYFPLSSGGGAKGAGYTAHAGADVSCFRDGGTLTAQMALVARVGERAAIEACRRAGIVPPSWLIGGGR
ncbi:MAG: hypothetical protein KF787_01335 [Phycisphaeraceae bacterium]|nr:hypothetical protein [Phycisphaeraceae bacterium]